MAPGDLERMREEFGRLAALAPDERNAALELLAGQDPALAGMLAGLFAVDDAAERWFDGLLEPLAAQRLAELDSAWAAGRRVGPYRLERLIATGGMGAVFLARKADGELTRPVALKLVPPEHTVTGGGARLRQERDLLARLSHPNIAQLFDAGVDDQGRPWIAMEYVDGLDPGRWCAAHAEPRARLELFVRLCGAVAFAHRQLIVHGDIKPANLRIDRHGRLKLLDFGIARLLRDTSEREAGTSKHFSPGFAAPEVEAGARPDVGSDIYSLGRTLEALLAAVPPVRVPELRAIVQRATDADPERRYPDAGALEADIEAWLGKRPVAAYSDAAGYRFGKWLRRHWAAAGTGLAVFGMLVAFAVISQEQARRFAAERDKARQLAGFLQQVFTGADPEATAGRDITARELLDRGVEQIETIDAEASVQADFLATMALTYQRLGDYRRAGDLFRRVAELQQARLDAGLRERARIRIEIAETAHADGRFSEARAEFERALDLLDHETGAEARLLAADAMSKLGATLERLGERQRGIALIEQALDITRAHAAPGSPRLAERLNEAGIAWLQRGRPAQGIGLLDEALAIRRRLDEAEGRTSPRTATLINNIGLMHYLSGAPGRAGPRFEEALQIRRALLPGNHPDIAQTLTNLGLMHKDYGDPEQALALLEEALEIRRAGLRPDHLKIAQGMLNLAIAHRLAGRFDTGRALFEDGIGRLEALVGTTHPMTAVAHNDYGALLLESGDLAAAAREYRRAVEIRAEALPEDHPHQAWSLLGLGRVLLRQGDPDAALPLLERAAAIRRAHLPDGDALREQAEAALARARAARASG